MVNKFKILVYFIIFSLIVTNIFLLSQFFWNRKDNLSIETFAKTFEEIVNVDNEQKVQEPKEKKASLTILDLTKISKKTSTQNNLSDFTKLNNQNLANKSHTPEPIAKPRPEPSPQPTNPTPTPTPEPTPDPIEYIGHKHEYEDKIRERCNTVGCNTTQVIKTMYCESNGDPNAQSPKGTYKGLFQYSQSTFNSFSVSSGLSGADIWNADHQIHTTAWAFANGKSSHWPHCSNI
jgi:hypothetical protein